jgi:hypothetical protein
MMGMTAIAIRDGTLCALHVNRVTDYEGIDRQQKSERAGPYLRTQRRKCFIHLFALTLPTFSNPLLHGIEPCVIGVVDYPAGILDCPNGLAPLLLSCSLVVT